MIEDSVREAILAELERQAANDRGKLRVTARDDLVQVEGEINLDELVMAIMGSVAGGP